MPAYFIVMYLLFTATTALFTLRIGEWSFPVLLLILPALFFYPVLYLLPSILLSTATALATVKMREHFPVLRLRIAGCVLFLTLFITHYLLLMDAGLYFRYAYHINPHILNIFTTPGGFEGMGLTVTEMISFAAGTVLLIILLATTRPILGKNYLYPLFPFNPKKFLALIVRHPISRKNT